MYGWLLRCSRAIRGANKVPIVLQEGRGANSSRGPYNAKQQCGQSLAMPVSRLSVAHCAAAAEVCPDNITTLVLLLLLLLL
jgi:hypothetical protein